MGNGWICLHRSLTEHWIWEMRPFSPAQAWIDLLLIANHKDTKKEYRNGQLVEFAKGTINRSIADLSERWGWDRKKTSKFLQLLQSDNMVTVKSTTHGTTICVVNYSEYQDRGTTDGTTTPQPLPRPLPQPLPINNNDNNDNNDNNKRERSKFSPPTLQEVTDYCIERKNHVSPQKFISYYESNGWMVGRNHMKDWKAAVRTWEQRDKEEGTQQQPQAKRNQSLEFAQRTYTDDDIRALERKKLGLE